MCVHKQQKHAAEWFYARDGRTSQTAGRITTSSPRPVPLHFIFRRLDGASTKIGRWESFQAAYTWQFTPVKLSMQCYTMHYSTHECRREWELWPLWLRQILCQCRQNRPTKSSRVKYIVQWLEPLLWRFEGMQNERWCKVVTHTWPLRCLSQMQKCASEGLNLCKAALLTCHDQQYAEASELRVK